MGVTKRFLFGGLLWSLSVGGTLAEAALRPPFSLKWGDDPLRLSNWARSAGLDQVIKIPGAEPRLRILSVVAPKGQTLPQHDASTVEARFRDGSLFEVAVHYTYPGHSAVKVRERFLVLKNLLAKRHGEFAARPPKVTGPVEGVSTTLSSFRNDLPGGYFLLLAMTEVVDVDRGVESVRFSVIYHWKPARPVEVRRDAGADGVRPAGIEKQVKP